MTTLLTLELRYEQDVVLARQRARQIAGLIGFEAQDQVRIAAAISEIARNAIQHAGGGRADFNLVDEAPARLEIRINDHGPGIPNLRAILDGRFPAEPGKGMGIVSARRVMDQFQVESSPQGVQVTLGKTLSKRVAPLAAPQTAALKAALAHQVPDNIFQEFQAQNQELLRTLAELRKNQTELAEVNRELQETNRGVVALYAELEEKADSIRRLAEQKSRFYSNLSHEFRTPIHSILSLARILLDRLDGELTTEQEKQVALIHKSAGNLLEWVNDLLDLAKAEAGKLVVKAEPFSIAEFVAALRGTMRPLVNNPAVQLVIEDPPPLPPAATDEGKLSQILRNLISNALKFTPSGEIRLTVQPSAGDRLAFAVSDTGVGISPADQPRVFKEFVQVEGPHQHELRGTGLGLPLSRALAELLGGTLTVSSQLGVGSRFTLVVPRNYTSSDGAPPVGATEVMPPETPPAASHAARSILIIDDDEAARYVLKTGLLQQGFSVVETADGEEGLRLARQLAPQAVFLDLKMPGLSGYQVLDLLKGDPHTQDTPVIIHTSEPLEPASRDALRSAVAIIAKDATLNDSLFERVRAALATAGVLSPSATKEQHHA